MIGGASSVSANLSSVYATTSNALNDALLKLASGKKFQNAGEDLLGFVRTTALSVDISGYQQVKENLTEAKTYTAAALQAGSSIYEKLTEMKDLAVKYSSETDNDRKANFKAEFDALVEEVKSIISNTRVDGTVVTATAEVKKVDLDPDGDGSLSITFTAIADTDSLDVEDSLTVDTQLTAALTYLSEAKAFNNIIDQQIKLTDTIISSKQAVMSLISDVDEAEQMNQVIDLSIRQQATISLLAQGNMIQSSLARLYD
jgi:flagellin-like hook-associated protein FlgL